MIDSLKNLSAMLSELQGLNNTLQKMPQEALNLVPEGDQKEKMKDFLKSVNADAKSLNHKGIMSKVNEFKREMNAD